MGRVNYMPTKYVPRGRPCGRPSHVPTDESRRRVLQAAALGVRHDGICKLLERAGDVLVEEIAGAMYAKAIGGDIGAQKYILGCRAGWSEKQVVEHTGTIEKIERIFIEGPEANKMIDVNFKIID